MVINARRLIKIVKKWQKFAGLQRKRISPRNNSRDRSSNSNSFRSATWSAVNKGHFVVYTADQGRFVVPLAYLNDSVFRELLNMSAEEYGLPSDGPITFPCNSIFLDYVMYLIRQGTTADFHDALLNSVATTRCLSSTSVSGLYEGQMKQRLLVY